MMGNTPIITEYIEFDFYQPVYVYDTRPFDQGGKTIDQEYEYVGRYLGPAHRVGNFFCAWVVGPSGVPITRTDIRPISTETFNSLKTQAEITALDAAIADRLSGDHVVSRELP